jgi:hypothetical protein
MISGLLDVQSKNWEAVQIYASCVKVNQYKPRRSFCGANSRLTLVFWDAGFHALDVGGSKTSCSSLMLWTTEAGAYRSHQCRDGSTHGEFPLPWSTLSSCCCCCRHIVEVALTQRRYEGREISQKVYIRSKLRRYFVEGGSVGSELGALQRFSFSNPAFSGA